MATRIDVKKDRERRLRTKRDVNSPNLNTKPENGNSKSQIPTASISPRRNTGDLKTKRANVSPEIAKEEHKKTYNKFGAIPRKNVTSDSVFIVPQNSNGVAKTTTTKAQADRKPTTAVSRRTGDGSESTSVSVSRLKHLFDGSASDVKPRPKSDIMHVTIEPASLPVSGRWSLPDYSRKGTTTPSSTQGHKIHVSKGIAAKRAKFEAGGSNENLAPRRESLRLSDLVPGIDHDDVTVKETDFRSRTKSDPCRSRLSGVARRRRSPSDTEALGSSTGSKKALDDSVVKSPRKVIGNLYKSKSAEHLFSSELTSPTEDISEGEDIWAPGLEKSGNKEHRSTEQVPVCESTALPSFTPNKDDREKNSVESVQESRNSAVYIRRLESKNVNKQVPVVANTPGKVREASWEDEPDPVEETEHHSPSHGLRIALPTLKSQEKDHEIDQPKESHSLVKSKDEKEEQELPEDQEEDSEMSDNGSTGSVVEHSSPEEVSSPVSLLFHAKPLLSAIARDGGHRKRKTVGFSNATPEVGHTYSPEEYNRGNNLIDPVTASAEWELEKRVEKMDVFSVDLEKDDRGLGLSIIGLGVGTDTGVEKLGIFVKSLTEEGAAEKDGRIQVNDQIIEVNGVSLVGVTQQFAGQTLKHTSGTVKFLMGRDKNKQHSGHVPTHLSNDEARKSIQELQAKLNQIEDEKQKAEQRASIAEMKLENVKNQGRTEASTPSSSSDHKKLEKALAEITDRAQKAETELAIAEAENGDMVKQLEESKGLYLILEKKYHQAKNTIKEHEAKRHTEVETMKKSNETIQDLQRKVRELERQVKEAKQRPSAEQADLISQESLPSLQEAAPGAFLGLDLDSIAGGTPEQQPRVNNVDLNTVPATETLSNAYLLEKKRLAEAQQKKYKPTRASWGKSLDDYDQIFTAQDAEDDDEEELNQSTRDEPSTITSSGPAFMLPGIPRGGFKLRPTGRELCEDSAAQKDPGSGTRASFPLSSVERAQGVVVENLLEQQLTKEDGRVASLPGNTSDHVDHPTSPVESPEECFSASTNSLDEIEQATRRIDSDLASSMASSTGSSPFLPPAMPLLEVKGSYKEVAVDVPPDLLLSASQSDSEAGSAVGSPGQHLASPHSQGEGQSAGGQSPHLSRWSHKSVNEWDTNQVGMWLVGLELPEYLSVFANRNIDGRQLLNLDTSKMKSMAINQNHRAILKKKIKELKVELEREKKQREKEQKAAKKEAKPKDKLEKIGFMKKGKSYTVNSLQ